MCIIKVHVNNSVCPGFFFLVFLSIVHFLLTNTLKYLSKLRIGTKDFDDLNNGESTYMYAVSFFLIIQQV